jgi:hypothetical protein
MGFGVSKISSKNGDDAKKKFTLGCSRARSYVLKPNPIKSTCKVRVNVCVSLDRTITIARIFLEHNHKLSPNKAKVFLMQQECRPSHNQRRLELNDRVGINVSRNFRGMVVEANE